MSCFTINPRGRHKHPVNIATIAFKGQDLPDMVYIGVTFYKVKPYIYPPCQCQNCWRFGHPAKYCRSTARCPLCASSGHTCTNCPTINICANCTQEYNVFFRGCSVYKFESEVAALRFKRGLTLKEARQETHLCCFQQVSFSQYISINTPQTTTNTDSPPTTSFFFHSHHFLFNYSCSFI